MDRGGSNVVALGCTGLLAAIASSTSCDGTGIQTSPTIDRAAIAICKRLESCGCFDLPRTNSGYYGEGYGAAATASDCALAVAAEFTPSEPTSAEYGYYIPRDDTVVLFDERCLDTLVRRIERAPCGELPIPTCEEDCALYYGTGHEGQACGGDHQVLCGRGLVCLQGECRDRCAVVLPAHEGESCLGRACDDGLACRDRYDPDARDDIEVCVALPGAGSPCAEGECAAGAWCDSTSSMPLCRAVGEIGDACRGHGQCVSAYCPAGHCARPPGDGEPCGTNRRCDAGLVCIDDGDLEVCRAVAPLCSLLDGPFD